MITRQHTQDGVQSRALYSDCENYRYLLERSWNPRALSVLYIMLNPSKATELKNDPTIERCERRARLLGFGGLRVANVFSWRETRPEMLKKAADPVGPETEALLLAEAEKPGLVLCAWGVHGAHMNRGAAVKTALRAAKLTLFNLGLTKEGHPRHPLYVPYDQPPMLWD